MFIDSKKIEKKKYKEFINFYLKKSEYIILSFVSDGASALFGDIVSLPTGIDYHSVILSEKERVCCFNNLYHISSSIFSRYNSIREFIELNDIYRLIFANNYEVLSDCMYDGITTW